MMKVTFHGETIEHESISQSIAELKAFERECMLFLLQNHFAARGEDEIVSTDIQQVKSKVVFLLQKVSSNVSIIEAKLHTVPECMDMLLSFK